MKATLVTLTTAAVLALFATTAAAGTRLMTTGCCPLCR